MCAPTQPCAYNMIKCLQARECGSRRLRTIEKSIKKIIRENEPVSKDLAALRARKASIADQADRVCNMYSMCNCATHYVSCQYMLDLRAIRKEESALQKEEPYLINADYWTRCALMKETGL